MGSTVVRRPSWLVVLDLDQVRLPRHQGIRTPAEGRDRVEDAWPLVPWSLALMMRWMTWPEGRLGFPQTCPSWRNQHGGELGPPLAIRGRVPEFGQMHAQKSF